MNKISETKPVGYLGPAGTYSHSAAVVFAAGRVELLVPHDSVSALLSSYQARKTDTVVVPFENGLGGDVAGVFGWSCKQGLEQDYRIIQEVILPIRHALLGVSGATMAGIKRVYSKDNALIQCLDVILHNGWEQREAESTAKAAWAVSVMKEKFSAAIGPPILAEMYGLEILSQDIMNNPDNHTRFLVFSRDRNGTEAVPDAPDKATLLLKFASQAGALRQRLVPFETAGINLSRISSWTAGKRLGQYVFWVDAEVTEPSALDEALVEIQSRGTEVIELGRYPTAVVG